MELATFGAGCFWCVEAIFRELRGVEKVESGYSGGNVSNPTTEQIYFGNTGHAEVVQITFNPKVIGYEQLLNIFWRVHDPTTLNRQGHDVGAQYRSVVFYHDDAQRQLVEKTKNEVQSEEIYLDPIVTEIVPYSNFYPATEDHQSFYEKNPNQPYCQLVIDPKLQKFRQEFARLRKSD